MKRNILIGTLALVAGSLIAADASPKDDVINAAKKLAEKSNYSWRSTVEAAGGGGRTGGPTDGKTEKGGYTCLSMTRGDNTIEAYIKGDKGAIKTPDGWQSLAEAADTSGGQPGPGAFVARMLRTFKAPAAQAEDLASKTKELKKDGDACASELTEDGAKSLLTFGGRGGANAPEVSDAKGSAKFWIKDGVLSKFEIKVQGKVSFNGNERDVDRTTTVEIKDVGTTKIEVPEDAKKKMP
jgi:hypothetical protein